MGWLLGGLKVFSIIMVDIQLSSFGVLCGDGMMYEAYDVCHGICCVRATLNGRSSVMCTEREKRFFLETVLHNQGSMVAW